MIYNIKTYNRLIAILFSISIFTSMKSNISDYRSIINLVVYISIIHRLHIYRNKPYKKIISKYLTPFSIITFLII